MRISSKHKVFYERNLGGFLPNNEKSVCTKNERSIFFVFILFDMANRI